MIVASAAVAAAWVIGVYRLARELLDGAATALTAAAFLAASPIVLLHTALPMAYAFAAATLTIAIAALLRGVRTGGRSSLLAGGAALGLAAMARPFDAALMTVACAPLLVSRARRPPRNGVLRRGAWVCVGAAPFAVAIAAYCRHVTGSMFTLPLTASDPLDRFGFGERRILPSEATFAFTRRLALDAFCETLDAAPGWLFGGRVLVALAVVGLLVRKHRSGRLLLAATVAVVFAAYFFWWGSAMAMPGLADGLGPHYHMVALAPTVVLAGSGACWLWRRIRGRLPRPARIPLAAVCLVPLVAVTAVEVAGKVDVQQYVNSIDEFVLDTIPDDIAGPAVVVVTPPTPKPYTQVPYHFLRNSPDLSDEVLYAADLGAANATLADEIPGRRLYQLRPDELHDAAEPMSFRGSFVELHPVEGKTIEIRMSLTVPAGFPHASVYLRLGDRTVVDQLDVTGAGGHLQTVAATLDGARELVTVGSGATGSTASGSTQGISFAGVQLPAYLTIGLAVGPTPDLAGAWRWEERVPVARRGDGRLVTLGPGSGWRLVPGLYNDTWVQATVRAVLTTVLEPRS